MTVRNEITGLFRGVPVKAIRRDIALGSAFLVQSGTRHLHGVGTAAIRAAAARPAAPAAPPTKDAQPAAEAADVAAAPTTAAPAGKKPPAAPPKKTGGKADMGEAVALAVLTLGAVAAAGGGILGPLAHRLAPYVTVRHVVTAVVWCVLVWSVAAWFAARHHPDYRKRRAAPTGPPASEQTPPEPAAEASADAPEEANDATFEGRRLAFLVWLERTTRGTAGIHFAQLHAQLSEHPLGAGLQRGQIRPLLDTYGIGWKRTLRVGQIGGRSGVPREAVEQALAEARQAAARPSPPALESAGVELSGERS